ncbi:hypothetical protein BsWGS_17017 [Bradybaena similaris]
MSYQQQGQGYGYGSSDEEDYRLNRLPQRTPDVKTMLRGIQNYRESIHEGIPQNRPYMSPDRRPPYHPPTYLRYKDIISESDDEVFEPSPYKSNWPYENEPCSGCSQDSPFGTAESPGWEDTSRAGSSKYQSPPCHSWDYLEGDHGRTESFNPREPYARVPINYNRMLSSTGADQGMLRTQNQ